MKVTVLMTLYNKGAFVLEAVESVLGNTLQDIELLVVDDASTDDGPEKVRSLKDPRVRLLTSEHNTGRPAAANRGLNAAQGEYIAIVDADDLVHPERFAKQAAFLDANPEIGACGSAIRSFGGEDRVIGHPADDAQARAQVLFTVPMIYPALMMRRSVVEQHHIRCDANWLRPGMDQLFLVTLTARTRIANLPDVLMYYRVGEQNMRHGRDPVQDFIHLDREVFRLVGLPVTDAQLDLHVHLHRPFVQRLNAERVQALYDWTKELAGSNRKLGVFPEVPFEREIEARWSQIFFPLADRDTHAAWVHLRCSGTMRWDRLSYLLKSGLRRALRGRRN